jgi:hypothetical protein
MLDCYRTGGANNPETFVTAVAATLARYPDQVIYDVTDPTSGIPKQITWMPSIKEIYDTCERAMAPIRYRIEHEKRVAEQMELRRLEDEARAKAPSYDQLKEKYGADWGIKNPDHKKRSPAAPAPTAEQLRHHYQHYDLQFRPKRQDELEQQIDRGIGPSTAA